MPVDMSKFRPKGAVAAPATNQAPAQGQNTLTPRGFLRGFNGTDKFEYGNYFELGTYNVAVKKCLHMPRSNNTGVPLYIVEFDVLEVVDTKEGLDRSQFRNPDGTMKMQNKANKVGDVCSMAQSLKDPKIAAPVLSAFAQALGRPADQEERQNIIDNFEEMLEEGCGEAQPLRGDTLQIDAVPHQTKKKEWIVRLLFKEWAPEGA